MNKKHLLTILVIALALLNLVTLTILYFGAKANARGQHKGMGPMTAERSEKKEALLGFDEAQLLLFKKSQDLHKASRGKLNDQLHSLSSDFYHLTNQPKDSVRRDELMNEIEKVNEMIYKANLEHFDELREISTEDQKIEVEKFIDGLLRIRPDGPPNRKGPPRKKE